MGPDISKTRLPVDNDGWIIIPGGWWEKELTASKRRYDKSRRVSAWS